jgi:hypothetical protein
MQNRSFVPISWGKVGLAILPGLFAFGTSWVIEAKDLVPIAGLGLCVLLSVLGLIRERRVPIWTFITLGVLFSLLIRPIWLLLGLPGLLAAIAGLIWVTHRKRAVHFPRSIWILLRLMILVGIVGVVGSGLWVLLGDGAMLFVIAVGLLLAKRSGLSAGLFVAAAGFILWEEILDLTYCLWKAPYGIVMVAILALLLLIVSPIWVLRSRSARGQVWGLLLPAFVALVSVTMIDAIVRTDPSVLDRVVNIRAIVPSTAGPWCGVGVRGKENLVPLLVKNNIDAAQLFIGMVLAVALYHWIEHRGQAADNNQEDVTALDDGPATATAHR